jgi:hypothetical protein
VCGSLNNIELSNLLLEVARLAPNDQVKALKVLRFMNQHNDEREQATKIV